MTHLLQEIGGWTWYVVWAALLLCASLLVYLGLGGNFILVGLALLHALITGFDPIGWPLLGILLGIALLGELVEFVLGNFYVLRKGASGRATMGGFLGGLVGALLGNGLVPLVGAVVGSFVGAFLGSVAGQYWQQRRLEPSLRVGGHAFVGRMLAVAFKHGCGLVMVFLILRSTFPTA
ncbi:MAG: DUF456 domain-containing protein [Candidatus Krumholzibacteriia bacterium]